jgi:hypothetical protein
LFPPPECMRGGYGSVLDAVKITAPNLKATTRNGQLLALRYDTMSLVFRSLSVTPNRVNVACAQLSASFAFPRLRVTKSLASCLAWLCAACGFALLLHGFEGIGSLFGGALDALSV